METTLTTTLRMRSRWLVVLTLAVLAANLVVAPKAYAAGVAYPIQIDGDDWHTMNSAVFQGNEVIIGDVLAARFTAGHFRFTGIPTVKSVTSATLRVTAANTVPTLFPTGEMSWDVHEIRFAYQSDAPCSSGSPPGKGQAVPSGCYPAYFEMPWWFQGQTYEIDVTADVQRMMAADSDGPITRLGNNSIEFTIHMLGQLGNPSPQVQIVAHEADPALAASLAINW